MQMASPGAPIRQFFYLLGLALLLWHSVAIAQPISLTDKQTDTIGLATAYLIEPGRRLDLPEVSASLQAGRFSPGNSQVLNFGIGSSPVWLHFSAQNPTRDDLIRRLTVATSWLDSIDVYILQDGLTIARYHMGDRQPFLQRPINNRHFELDHTFPPGLTDVFLRIETPDPMVVPIFLQSPDATRDREALQGYSYGFVYGFIFALMAYNATLFLSLRSPRFLFYSLYLALFLAMNITYTGHGFAWLWPESVKWQQWSHPLLIYGFGSMGLLFATRFLDTRQNFPRIHRGVLGFTAVFGAVLTASMLLGDQIYALLTSFVFAFLFTWIMLGMGIVAVRAGQKPARYFLLAALAAMMGAMLTTLSVWGFITFNYWTFRAVEMGMLVDATLLALALAYQIRVEQEERLRAEQLAQLDPLTGLNNRRAFYDKTVSPWNTAIRNNRNPSVMLLDIDLFKNINDTYGHAHGDEVLVALADKLKNSVRQGDVLARWGGEEFIVFLPETSPAEAHALAERLRSEISALRIPRADGQTSVTASFGVAQKEAQHATLDALIAAADELLYQAKQQGRNRVICAA